MGKTALIRFPLVCLFLASGVIALELIANYKFWDSTSNQIIYDYSGNSRHGNLTYYETLTITDRGIYTILYMSFSGLSIHSTTVEEYSDFALSFWAFKFTGYYSNILITLNGDLGRDFIYYDFADYFTSIYSSNGYYNYNRETLGWNLLTVRCYFDTNYKLQFLINLDSLDIFDSDILGLKYFGFDLNNSVIMYELWLHAGLSSINDLKYLIYNNCPTSPINYCPPLYDIFKNKEGSTCPIECTTNNFSCDSNLNCIIPGKSSCLYGLYHLESEDCIFYCPEDSCTCYLREIVDNNWWLNYNLDCSCKEGFKKISEEFVGCVPESWVNYHKEGYIYVIDDFEPGYVLDSNGNCCICEDGYRAVSTDPLVCIYMPNCLAYTQEDSNYICSECIEGYHLNSDNQCLECKQGYYKISEIPLQCTLRIENCLDYIQIEDSWKCRSCATGTKLSSSGLCDECQEGYLKIESNSSLCKAEINRCIEYDMSSVESKCVNCEAGFRVDFDYKCNYCESGYVQVSYDHLECALEVLNCNSYTLFQSDWVCNSCNLGYKLDIEMKCNLCDEGYISQSAEVLECILNSNYVPDSGNTSDNSENSEIDEEENQEEVITQAQKERGETIQSVSTATTSTVMASTSVSGAVSMNPSTLIFYLNTIQLLSFIQYLNLKIPFEIKQEQSAGKKFMSKINILSYMKLGDRNPSEYMVYILDDDRGFLPNIIYQLLILMLLFLLHIIYYYMNKYGRGKIKTLSGKILKFFLYNIYIQFLMMTYVDFADSALLKILNVRSI